MVKLSTVFHNYSAEARVNDMNQEREEYKTFLTAVCHKCMEHKTVIQVCQTEFRFRLALCVKT